VEHTGYYGIFIEGQYPFEGDINRDWTIDDVRINNVGELVGDGGGIIIANSGHNTLSHLDIHDGPRNGIFMTGWNVGAPLTDVYTVANYVHHVRLTDLMQDSGDNAALTIAVLNYQSDAIYPVNTFEQIIIDDVSAHASMTTDAAPNGVYCDSQTNGQTFINVQVTDTQGNQFRQHESGDHTLTNTSFLIDGTPNGAFNTGAMDTANIGTTGSFPY
jgi:hypothetical protein